MNQPHIHELGAFDPAAAFGQTVYTFIQLVEGVKEEPTALPPHEVLRAAQVAVDTLEAITEVTLITLKGKLASMLPDDAVSDHRITQEAQNALMSDEEKADRRMQIMRRVATFFPHEVDLDNDDGDDDDT